LIKLRRQNSGTGQAATLFTDLGDVAPDYILDGMPLKVIAIFKGVHDASG
jgi:hypothetical protein